MSRFSVLHFCLRSLWTEYGWEFIYRVLLKHPVLSWKGIRKYIRRELKTTEAGFQDWLQLGSHSDQNTERIVIGLGFCLKPLALECPSGRANHSCLYLECRDTESNAEAWEACQDCVIREMGDLAMRAGFDLYIMTSARDILRDILLPALEEKRHTSAVLALCRYSFEPFQIALDLTGINGFLIEYAEGDCCDYSTWRRADKGHKIERTCLRTEDLDRLRSFLSTEGEDRSFPGAQRKRNIYTPCRITPRNKNI